MLKKVLKVADFEEERKLQIRRQVEEERKQRIFNARERTIGIDVAALERQSNEKIERQSHEDEMKQLWQRENMRQKSMLDMQVEMEAQRKREIAADIQRYRSTYQLPELRREFDLNDPKALIKEEPNNAMASQRVFGISSGQFFDGEDLGKAEREQRQREQQRSWLVQQRDMQISEQQRRAAERSRSYTELQCDESYGRSMEKCIEYQRAKNAMIVREFNAELAKKKSFERKLARQENEEDNRAEIINMMASDLLNEDPSKKPPLHRTPSSLHHGLTLVEPEIYNEGRHNESMALKSPYKTAEEKARAEEHFNEQHAIYEQECERRRLQLLHQLSDTNLQLAREQREQRQREEDNSRNAITDEFFCKFNVTSR